MALPEGPSPSHPAAMMHPARYRAWLGGFAALGAAALLLLALRPAGAQISFSGTAAVGPFTQTQVDAGRIAYNAACGACHGINLLDGTHRTPLIGPSFMVGWGRRSTIEYMRYVRYRMPLREPGSLSLETYADITAYILAANGSLPGTETMTDATAVTINTIADGVVREPVLSGTETTQ